MTATLFVAGFCIGLAVGLGVVLGWTGKLKEVRQEQFRLELELKALKADARDLQAAIESVISCSR